MTRQCPAVAYLSSLRSKEASEGKSSTFNTDDLTPVSINTHQRNVFLKDLVNFMYQCHAFVKPTKENQKDKKFTLSDSERKESIAVILDLISQKEQQLSESQQMLQFSPQGPGRPTQGVKNLMAMRFDPKAKSTPISPTAVPRIEMTGTYVSHISNAMSPREFPTPPRVSRGTQNQSGLSSFNSPSLMYGASSPSSPSTDPGSPVRMPQGAASPGVARALPIAARASPGAARAPPGAARASPQATAAIRICESSPRPQSYSSYACPYKRTLRNLSSRMATMNSSRAATPPTVGSYGSRAIPSPVYVNPYSPGYASPTTKPDATAQTSNYDFGRGATPPAKHYQQSIGLNKAYVNNKYNNEEYTYDGQQGDYAPYKPATNKASCACR